MKRPEFKKLEALKLSKKEKSQIKGGTGGAAEGGAIGGAFDAAGGIDGDTGTAI